MKNWNKIMTGVLVLILGLSTLAQTFDKLLGFMVLGTGLILFAVLLIVERRKK